ncbi:unnamed protein product [Rotaria sp. Silwood2]|nr:unnamed protein product [Rotaria sp. Silwood2]CAF4467646.1 unnamed protein product [Rotaria sp. Silwood2]
MKYAGRWHTEGSTENIIAAGVYYVHVDDELKGGALKFRPKHAPQPWYDISTDKEVSVSTDAAIVFSNTIPHRFRQIRNLTEKNGLRRTFLNFFIVDPYKPIDLYNYSSRVLAPLDIIISILDEASDGCLMIGPILNKIIQYLGPSAWKKIEDAKEFRAQVRKLMINEESGWGWINWGNCGTVEFVPARCLYEDKDECENLRHTESE